METINEEIILSEMEDLKEAYDRLREKLLEEAEKRNLLPEYAYENESGREIPESFSSWNDMFSIRNSKLFNTMCRESVDKLRELLDNPVLLAEYLKEIFGPYDESVLEIQNAIEREEALEAA